MTSIFERSLGADFRRLHPLLREGFGFSSADGIACVGTGIMDTVWHGRGFTRPFLALGARRNILIREAGQGIPFTIVDYLGTHQHIAVDLHLRVDDGALLIESGEQRLHEGPFALRVPSLVTGQARVRESYDERIGQFRIEVAVTNRWFGPACNSVPVAVQPVREQLRV